MGGKIFASRLMDATVYAVAKTEMEQKWYICFVVHPPDLPLKQRPCMGSFTGEPKIYHIRRVSPQR